MDILERLKLRTEETDENLLNDCIETAKNAILSRRFPYGDWPTIDVPAVDANGSPIIGPDGRQETVPETFVEDRYLDLQFRIAMDLYNKIGAEGETAHSENGISRTFESSWISSHLLQEVVPYVGWGPVESGTSYSKSSGNDSSDSDSDSGDEVIVGGVVFVPSIDSEGNLSWTNNGGYTNPPTVNIMGPQGETGPEGPEGPQGAPGLDGENGKDGENGQDGKDGEDGKDGVSPTISVEDITGGHRVTITDAEHPSGQSFDVMDGKDGEDGEGGGGSSVTVDSSLSSVSENPVQSKAIKAALDTKQDTLTINGKSGASISLTASDVNAVPTSAVGTASGVAELDSTGKVPSSQLPSYVDDVVDGYYRALDDRFYEDSGYSIEIPEETGKIYIDVSTNLQYRWTGSGFSALGGALVLGETSSTAYRGDRGKVAYDTSQANAAAIGTLSNLDTATKANLVAAINEVLASGMANPTGTVIYYAGLTAPAGYLACDGTIYGISEYPTLATFFETNYGAKNYWGGDGNYTFAVPDWQGEFFRAAGTQSREGQGKGSGVGTHQNATLFPPGRLFMNGTSSDYFELNSSTKLLKSDSGKDWGGSGSNCYQTELNKDSVVGNDMDGGYKRINIAYSVKSVETSSNTYDVGFTSRPTNTSLLVCIKT